MATSTTPPPIQGPTAKEKKYDRQLRLWAANGQKALEEAHILLLNGGSGAVGTETLKNLVLPGIGAFTIIDEATVQEQDLGVNFFLEEESLGKSRAFESVRLLRELNPEVQGIAISQSIDLWLSNSDISPYSLILLVGPVQRSTLTKAATQASRHSIPLFYIRSVGFYSTVTIQLPSLFPIVETHPDPTSTLQDLRLLAPWPELLSFTKSKTSNLDSLSDHDHGHVPYLLLLLHYLEQWHAIHNSYPTIYKEKAHFRDQLRAAARTSNPEGGEENFDEAVAAVLKALNPSTVPSGLRGIFQEPECQHPTTASAHFWVIAHALAEFVQKNGVLPLPGSIPDMKARSADYIALQNVYRAKAQSDLAAVTIAVRQLEEELNRPPVDGKEIEAFCKGAAFVKLVRGGTVPDFLADTQSEQKLRQDKLVAREVEDEESLLGVYLCLDALDASVGDAAVEKDLDGFLDTTLKKMLAGVKSGDSETLDVQKGVKWLEKYREEVSRAGVVELHNISSLTGGMAAQEAIKAITKQYVPVDNAIVLDGITSRTASFKF